MTASNYYMTPRTRAALEELKEQRFENAETYRRKPDLIHAVRLTAEGVVPLWHADADWIKRAVANKRLSYVGDAHKGTWFANTGVSLQAAYAGDWLVLHDATQAVEVVRDDDFRARFEVVPFAEDE